MKWQMYGVVTAIFLTVGTSGHTVHIGRTCPTVQPYPNLEVEKVLGTWYVLHKSDTDNNCLMWNISRGEFPETLQVKETRQLSVLDAFGIDHTHSVTARIDIPNPEVPGKMRIRWPTSITGKADFIVFDTDYNNYMAVFECDRAGFFHRRSTSILSRTPEIDDMFVLRVRRLLETSDVGHYYLSEINHDVCHQSGIRNWHIDHELFGFIPGVDEADVRSEILGEVQDYDVTQLEIFDDEVSPEYEFRGASGEGNQKLKGRLRK